MDTFEKEITFLSNTLVEGKFEMHPVTKRAAFFELSQTDSKQHKLFFLMMPLWTSIRNVGSDSTTIVANPEILHDLTLKAIDCLLVENSNFTIQDKTEFLNDGFAILAFGKWFLEEKFTAFFLSFMQNYQKSTIITSEQSNP
jgi:hypothetical protein